MIIVKILNQDLDYFQDFQNELPEKIKIVTKKKFHGEPEMVELLIGISSITVPVLAKVIIEYLKNRGKISMKYRGIEISNATEKNIKAILDDILTKELKSEENTTTDEN